VPSFLIGILNVSATTRIFALLGRGRGPVSINVNRRYINLARARPNAEVRSVRGPDSTGQPGYWPEENYPYSRSGCDMELSSVATSK